MNSALSFLVEFVDLFRLRIRTKWALLEIQK